MQQYKHISRSTYIKECIHAGAHAYKQEYIQESTCRSAYMHTCRITYNSVPPYSGHHIDQQIKHTDHAQCIHTDVRTCMIPK